jgi:hypothetical protein
MAITYEWKILRLRRDASGTVTEVYWSKTGTDESGRTAMFSMVDELNDGDPTSDSYIDFASLTEADVLAWIQGRVTGTRALDVDHFIQRKIQEQMDARDSIDDQLPWAPAELPPGMEQGA